MPRASGFAGEVKTQADGIMTAEQLRIKGWIGASWQSKSLLAQTYSKNMCKLGSRCRMDDVSRLPEYTKVQLWPKPKGVQVQVYRKVELLVRRK